MAKWFWRRRFLNFVSVFPYFIIISLGKGPCPFFLTNLNPLYPRMLWWKLVQWFWRRRCLNFFNVLSLFRSYLPLENAEALHLNKLEFPTSKDALCQVWLKLVQWFCRRWNCEKFMTTVTMDNGQILIRKAHVSLWLRWAKKGYLNVLQTCIW